MSIDWNQLSAWAAIITAIAAIVALYLQGRWFRFSLGVELLWRTEEQFRHHGEMIERRRKAAGGLIKGEFVPELDKILDFFEGLGLLVRKGALDEEMVWNSFYYRALGYWYSSRERISVVRAKDKTIWMEYEYLVNILIKIERRKSGKPVKDLLPTSENIKEFLLEEIKIA